MKTAQNNNFIAYLIFLIAFFVLLFFTKGIFEGFQISQDEKATLEKKLDTKKSELENLDQLKRDLETEGDITQEIAPYTSEYSEKSLLKFFYDYAEKKNQNKKVIVYKAINISEPEVSDLGFRKVNVTVSALLAGETTMKNFLTYMTSDENKFKFIIENFNYPMNESKSNIHVTVPLTLYVK